MNIKLVVFDLDGTMIASLEGIQYSMNLVLERHGYPVHSLDTYRLFVGDGLKKVAERALPDNLRNPDLVEKMYEELIDVYEIGHTHQLRLYDGIPEILQALDERHIQVAINTNKNQGVAQRMVDHLLRSHPIQLVVGSQEGRPKKPDPTGLRSIMSTLQISPQNTLFVGDSAVDLQTACNAGVGCILVTYGFRTREELELHRPQTLIDHPMDLLNILDHP